MAPRIPKRPDYGNATPEDLARALLRGNPTSVDSHGVILDRQRSVKPLIAEKGEPVDGADGQDVSVNRRGGASPSPEVSGLRPSRPRPRL